MIYIMVVTLESGGEFENAMLLYAYRSLIDGLEVESLSAEMYISNSKLNFTLVTNLGKRSNLTTSSYNDVSRS